MVHFCAGITPPVVVFFVLNVVLYFGMPFFSGLGFSFELLVLLNLVVLIPVLVVFILCCFFVGVFKIGDAWWHEEQEGSPSFFMRFILAGPAEVMSMPLLQKNGTFLAAVGLGMAPNPRATGGQAMADVEAAGEEDSPGADEDRF